MDPPAAAGAAAWAAGSAAAGWLAARLALIPAGRLLARPAFLRRNYRGRSIPKPLGCVLAASILAGVAAAAVSSRRPERDAVAVAFAGLALGALGFLDDVYASRRAGGFAGHLRALARGEVTTGLLKAAGGGAAGLAAAWTLGERGWWIVASGALVALSANLANLLDLRPGRAGKGWLVVWAATLAARPPAGALVVSAAVAGGLVAFLPSDLRERGMLGDTGANLLGAVAGTVAVASLGATGTLWALGFVALLTAASEVVSFSRAIERFPPLRFVDRLGRLRAEGSPRDG